MPKKPKLDFVKNQIIQILKKRAASLNQKQLSWALNLKGSEYHKILSKAIKELKKDHLLIESSKYKYRHNVSNELISGLIDVNSAGHGYVKTALYETDIFIHKTNRLNSLNLDLVEVRLLKNSKNKIEGEIIKVLKRSYYKFIGTIQRHGQDAFFIPENMKVGSHFFIPKSKLNSAINNNRVLVEFSDWPLSAKNPFGRVIRVLPESATLKQEIKNNIELLNLRNNFNPKIKKELESMSMNTSLEDLKNRKDFRKHITFTIDPIDAKDFDDALSLKVSPSGIIKIGIHIADVGHYIPVNSEIDKEAFLRAFSVYFPGQVIPMIPEKLSNEICSLNPEEDKLCFSVVVEFEKHTHKIKSTWIGKTIINSNKRFTYEEAENIIIGKCDSIFENEIQMINNIAQKLRGKRIKDGSIDFERHNISFKLNKYQEPIEIVQSESLAAHKLVEEFMLLANKIVAQKLSNKKSAIYRVHDSPDKDKIQDISNYLTQLKVKNTNLNIEHQKLPKIINSLLKDPKLKHSRAIIENLILRAMAKAHYSTKNIGHYGLGFKKYTHFTSPIRRYSDLIVHRLVYAVLYDKKINLLDLEKKCQHFSKTEKNYVDLERKINKFVQLKLLENSIGNTFNGIITGVVKWGIYVDIDGYRGEGLVPIKELTDDNYYYNSLLHSFVGRKSGRKYILGQKLIVKIKSINLFNQEMDLKIIN